MYASAGSAHQLSRCGSATRWASAPERLTRPRWAAASPPSTSTLISTNTSDNAQAAGTLNETPNSVKISVVNVW